MDAAKLRGLLDAERIVSTETIEDATFRVKLPSDHAWRVALQSSVNEDGQVIQARAWRMLLAEHLVGWSGIKGRHFGVDPADEAIEFSPAARELFLDHRPDLCERVILDVGLHRKQRRERLEAEKGNSSGGSSGTSEALPPPA